MVQLSTGDMLRGAVAAGTPVGIKAKAEMEAGQLVSDEIVIGILSERLVQPDVAGGFILDGFPRTVAQAEARDSMLAATAIKLDHVFELSVHENALVNRLTGPHSFSKCGERILHPHKFP